MKSIARLSVCFAIACPFVSMAHAHSTADEMATAAQQFLKMLSDEEKEAAHFEWQDDERLNWHFIPKERKGFPLKSMNGAQRALAHRLLITGLSHQGFEQTMNVMSMEQVLHEKENGNPGRDPANYYVSIFGEPDAEGTWGWRFEGHHLSLNYTVVEGEELSGTPAFFAANPAEVDSGPLKGVRIMAPEEDLARALVKSLNDEQKKEAVFSTEAPDDIITGAERKVSQLEPLGLSVGKLNDDQKKTLVSLIEEYVRNSREEVADEELARIEEAGWDKVHFAWAGGVEKGEGHYYRVQGDHFLLEYDNTQNGANHVHAVWRDFGKDFGEDLLKKHYEEDHK